MVAEAWLSMSPERLRAYVLIVMRDILAPASGVFIAIYLTLTNQLAAPHFPLIVSLIGIPFVAPRHPKDGA